MNEWVMTFCMDEDVTTTLHSYWPNELVTTFCMDENYVIITLKVREKKRKKDVRHFGKQNACTYRCFKSLASFFALEEYPSNTLEKISKVFFESLT
jgi:hypothetical protein